MEQVQHQVGLLFNLVVENERFKQELIESNILEEPIQKLQLNEVLTNTAMMMKLMEDNGFHYEEDDFIKKFEQAIKQRLDDFNDYFDEYITYFFPMKYKKVQISNIQEGAYYRLEGVESSLETLVNEIIHQYPAGIPLVVIIFQIGIAIKNVPMVTIRIDNPLQGQEEKVK